MQMLKLFIITGGKLYNMQSQQIALFLEASCKKMRVVSYK